MKILILEDSGERTKWFSDWFVAEEVIITNNAKVAIALLHSVEFDMVFLDHDLGGQTFIDSDDENCGYQVTKALPSTINRSTHVVIHSHNNAAAKRMVNSLSYSEEFNGRIDQVPFLVLISTNQLDERPKLF